jgi:2-(1,2-epoxy-1,2-dihydrophenyl)acetyl-CoA isomerase
MDDVEGLLFSRQGGIATATLNRPEKLNAITWHMVRGLTTFVQESGADDDVRVIVITGSGRAFSSGDDIVGGMGEPPRRRDLGIERGPHYEMVKAILGAPKPVVAALNGRTHGAGWVIALACDFRVAHTGVLIGDIRSEKAIFANQGVGLLLPHLIGKSRAMDLLLTGRVLDAAEAERYGIINRLWAPEVYEQELAAFVQSLANGPTRTYAAWKLSVNRTVLHDLDAYTDHERWLNLVLRDSEDTREGVQAFREKRPPHFTGR